MQLDYEQEKFIKTRVCGIECDFSNMRIDSKTVPKGRYHYCMKRSMKTENIQLVTVDIRAYMELFACDFTNEVL